VGRRRKMGARPLKSGGAFETTAVAINVTPL
jgi:hypothetical protein